MSLIEKINDRLYRTRLGDDDVEFGDDKETEFKPKLCLTRWLRRASLFIRFEDLGISLKQVRLEEGRLKWITPKVEAHFYRKPPNGQYEHGGIEFEIILKEKPLRNYLNLPIGAENLKFFYQPPLTEQYNPDECDVYTPTYVKLKDGGEHRRSENVVGSYAVYHASKRNNEFMSGKAFHIYRPLARDSDGREIWCKLNIDKVQGILTISIPQKTLDTATYPVFVDPTFGKTDIGGTTFTMTSAYVEGTNYQTGASSGDVDSLHVYTATVGDDIKVAIYDLASNSQTADPDALLYGSDAFTPTQNTWNQHDIPGGSKPSVAASTWYHLCFRVAGSTTEFAYDADAADSERYHVGNPWAEAWDNPYAAPGSKRNLQMSVYATYAVAVEVEVEPFIFAQSRAGQARSRLDFKRTFQL